MLYFLPLIGTFQSCQLHCRIRNLTLQQSVFRFQAVQMTCLQGGICSMQESIVEQVEIPVYKGSRPNTPTPHPGQPGTSAKKESWERMTGKLALSLNQYQRGAVDNSLHLWDCSLIIFVSTLQIDLPHALSSHYASAPSHLLKRL